MMWGFHAHQRFLESSLSSLRSFSPLVVPAWWGPELFILVEL
jgi:hypothetical protein